MLCLRWPGVLNGSSGNGAKMAMGALYISVILHDHCGLTAGPLCPGARYGQPETFLVKPPDFGPSGHPQSHFEQPDLLNGGNRW